MPTAFQHHLHGFEVGLFARRGVRQQRACVAQVRVGFVLQRRFGQAEQKAGLHDVRQRPARVFGHRAVQIGQRRVVEGHHPPQRLLGRITRCGM